MDEDFKWLKVDKITYEDFLQVSISSVPPGALTSAEVVSPLDVHPEKERKERTACLDSTTETSSCAIRMAERQRLRT